VSNRGTCAAARAVEKLRGRRGLSRPKPQWPGLSQTRRRLTTLFYLLGLGAFGQDYLVNLVYPVILSNKEEF